MKKTQKRKKRVIENSISNSAFSNKVFWNSFVLLLIFHCIGNTSVIYSESILLDMMYVVRNLVYLVLLFKLAFLTNYTKKEFYIVASFLLIGLITVITSRSFGLFEFFIVMIAAKDKEPKKLVEVFIKVKGTAILATLFLAQVGILETLYYEDDVVGAYSTYGFCHRNVLGANVVIVCLAYFYLRYKKIQIGDIIVWSAVTVITYKLAYSRTSLIVMVMIIAMFCLTQTFEKRISEIKNLEKVMFFGFIAIVLGMVLCTIIYNEDYWIWDMIDSLFTKRFYFANYCYEEYGFSLFGQNLNLVSSIEQQTDGVSKVILDNSYMRAILYYGIIPGAFVLATFNLALPVAVNRKNYPLLLSLLVFVFYGLSESYMIDIFYQFPIIVAWAIYFTPKKRRQKKKDEVDFWDEKRCNSIKNKALRYILTIKYSMLWHAMDFCLMIKAEYLKKKSNKQKGVE